MGFQTETREWQGESHQGLPALPQKRIVGERERESALQTAFYPLKALDIGNYLIFHSSGRCAHFRGWQMPFPHISLPLTNEIPSVGYNHRFPLPATDSTGKRASVGRLVNEREGWANPSMRFALNRNLDTRHPPTIAFSPHRPTSSFLSLNYRHDIQPWK